MIFVEPQNLAAQPLFHIHQSMGSVDEDWKAKVARKQEALRVKIPQAWLLPESVTTLLKYPLEKNVNRLIELDIPRKSGILNDRELKITEEYTVVSLLAALRSGELSAVEVTTAFSKRACIAGQLTNCLTETYYDEALDRARALDLIRERGETLGPLHGLPVSLKDSFQIKGSEASIGYVAYLDRISAQNSPLVELLLEQGAIYFVKTNIPMTMMTADSQNNIFGRTLNPHNTLLTAGGSSGGEGALVAFRGSPLGVGTDVAGSIRIPSLANGTYGFKPSTARVPYGGQVGPGDAGHAFFLAAAGPLSNDLEGIRAWMKAVIGATPAKYDATALDVPWRDVDQKTQLKIGILETDPKYPLQPPVQRVMEQAVSQLKAQGHTLISLPANQTMISEAVEISWTMFGYSGDGGKRLKESGEPPIPSLIAGQGIAQKLAKGSATYGVRDETLNDFQRLAATTVKRFALKEVWRNIWNQHDLDVVIAPAAQCTAIPHDTFPLPAYTVLLNCLDYPSCVIPFGKVTRQLDDKTLTVTEDQFCPEYDVAVTERAPCVVQVFGRPMRDEECLEACSIIDHCLRA